ncbi:hypothetical protein FO502_19080, partial [Bacillus pumilus]
FGLMPCYSILSAYSNEFVYVTFWLSMAVLFVSYYHVLSKKSVKLELPYQYWSNLILFFIRCMEKG